MSEKKYDSGDIAVTVLYTVIAAAMVLILVLASRGYGKKSVRQEAIERGFAHYEVDIHGESTFKWDEARREKRK
jgi:hypothetical protein